MGSKKIKYQHINNPKLKGETTEDEWNKIKPQHRRLYKIIEEDSPKTAETPPEIKAKRKEEEKGTEAPADKP